MVLLPAASNLVLLGCCGCSRSRQEVVCLPGNLLFDCSDQHRRDVIKGTLQRLATGFDSFHRIDSRDEETGAAAEEKAKVGAEQVVWRKQSGPGVREN